MKDLQLKREKVSTAADDLWVPVKFYCPLCKGQYKETVNQGALRKMPKYFTNAAGQRESIYVNNEQVGGEQMIKKVHKSCGQKYINWLREKEDKKKIIIGG